MQTKPLTAVNIKDVAWQETRFEDVYIRLLSFRDGVVFEIQRFDGENGTFPHQHDFRQLRYILEGEFQVNGVPYGPGTLIDFPEKQPYEVSVPNGGQWIVVQLPARLRESLQRIQLVWSTAKRRVEGNAVPQRARDHNPVLDTSGLAGRLTKCSRLQMQPGLAVQQTGSNSRWENTSNWGRFPP
jgi:hypothetical protein